jgi:uncharacterized protein YndB with AHSA1/START domain
MSRIIGTIIIIIATLGGIARADVSDAGPGGFTIVHEVVIDAPRRRAWQAAVDEVGEWWHDDHTISGDAGRLSIDPVPQGCFCETLGGGAGVVHLTVTMSSPTALLRLTGGLGPLGLMGVNGNMVWEFIDAGDETKVKFSYAVGGYAPSGLDEIAGSVDYVIGEALARLKAYVETGDANRASSD